jgi:crotonobetainyl-CoA:carnitine CoA-transferase CaiB-like acyl-CoA transferase/pimeloyl-ACP methyl ester carboxylesterase
VSELPAWPLAALGLAVARFGELRGLPRQRVAVDARRGGFVPQRALPARQRASAAAPWDPLSGFYPVRDGWISIHCNFPNHRDAALKVLQAEPNRQEAEKKATTWQGEALEDAIHAAAGCAGFVRSTADWQRHAQAQAVAARPLIEIVRIGDAPPEKVSKGGRPLEGIRVLDLTRVLAGPTCARSLAEHGADVLKISAAHLPDSGPMDVDTGIGKLSARLDLRTAEDRAKLERLATESDVFSQSYRPETLAARGFSPVALAALRPARSARRGTYRPWRARRGFDSIVQSVSGMAALSAKDGRPQYLPVSAIDYVSGYLIAFGATVALERRAREGGSWLVRVALARVGKWIADRGLLAQDAVDDVSPELPERELQALMGEMETLPAQSVSGPVVQLCIPAILSRHRCCLGPTLRRTVEMIEGIAERVNADPATAVGTAHERDVRGPGGRDAVPSPWRGPHREGGAARSSCVPGALPSGRAPSTGSSSARPAAAGLARPLRAPAPGRSGLRGRPARAHVAPALPQIGPGLPSSQMKIEPITGRYAHIELEGREHRLYFEEAGEGIALLCLHTAGSDGRQYRAVLNDAEITRRYRVIAFDMPWHGKSSPPAGWENEDYRLTTGRYTGMIMSVARSLGLERPVVMGCSIGGRIVLDLALRHGREFRALIGLQSGAFVERYYDPAWLDHPEVHGGRACGLAYGLMSPLRPRSKSETVALHAGRPRRVQETCTSTSRGRCARRIGDRHLGVPALPAHRRIRLPASPCDTQAVVDRVRGAKPHVMKGLGTFR